jgi:hypothetical protein
MENLIYPSRVETINWENLTSEQILELLRELGPSFGQTLLLLITRLKKLSPQEISNIQRLFQKIVAVAKRDIVSAAGLINQAKNNSTKEAAQLLFVLSQRLNHTQQNLQNN